MPAGKFRPCKGNGNRMKAIVFYAHGGVENLKYEEIPASTPSADEVLIRVRAVSLNGFDPMILKGTTSLKTPFPMSPGGDFSGEIVALGSSVNNGTWKVGDRVCPYPYIEGAGMMGETIPGACRELVTMPVRNLLRMPDDLSFVDAAALPIAYGTALRMMHTRGQIRAGEKVLIVGATGGVGTCCVQLAASAGAEVIACGSAEWKLRRLKEIGAAHVIDTSKEDILQTVRQKFGKPRYTGGGGVDVVVNYIGGDTWVPSLKVLRHQGRLLTCGATGGYAPSEDIRYIWSFELQIIGSDGWTYEDQTALMNMVVQGKLKPVIHSTRPLSETPQALQDLIERKVFGKSVLTVPD
jgi:alcohol dehydrogenase